MVILDNILPPNTNLLILHYLTTTPWYLSGDDVNKNKLQIALENNSGFHNITFQDDKYCGDKFLNLYAHLILDIVSDRLKIKTHPYRFFWNCYLTPSFSKDHRDWPEPNVYKTILYNIHTTDGGTEVENKFHEDKMGRAKVFESSLLHKGVSCKKDRARFNLNIMFGEQK